MQYDSVSVRIKSMWPNWSLIVTIQLKDVPVFRNIMRKAVNTIRMFGMFDYMISAFCSQFHNAYISSTEFRLPSLMLYGLCSYLVWRRIIKYENALFVI